MTVDVEFLQGLTPEELIKWTEDNLNAYLNVNAVDSALLGQLSRLGLVTL